MAGVYQLVTSLHDQLGNFFQNVFSYQLTEAGAGTHYTYAQSLNDQWQSDVQSSYLDLFGADVILDFISAKRVSPPGGPSNAQGIAMPGQAANPCVSSGIAVDIAWQTASGLNRPGHSYIGAFPNGAVLGDDIQAAYAALLAAWTADMLIVLTLGGGLGTATFGVYSRAVNVFNAAILGDLKPKLTMLNKRTLR